MPWWRWICPPAATARIDVSECSLQVFRHENGPLSFELGIDNRSSIAGCGEVGYPGRCALFQHEQRLELPTGKVVEENGRARLRGGVDQVDTRFCHGKMAPIEEMRSFSDVPLLAALWWDAPQTSALK